MPSPEPALPSRSGDIRVITPFDLVGRTVTCLLTNGIVLVCIEVKALEPYDGDLRLVYQGPAAGSDSKVPLGAIGHMHVFGTAIYTEPVSDPTWYVHYPFSS